jgi:hypothetical protein
MATQINNKSSFVIRGTLLVLSLFIGGSVAYAGGAFETLEDGTPITWQGTVTYRMDPGALKGVGTGDEGGGGGGGGGGCALHKEEASKNLDIGGPDFAGMVKNAATAWSNAAGGDLVIQEGPVLPENVNFSNAENFYCADFTTGEHCKVDVGACYSSGNCLNPIISDPNGLIIDALLGQCSRFGTFGVTSILPQTDSSGNVISTNLKSAQMIIGGTCIAPAEDPTKSVDCPQTDPCPVPGGFSTDEVQNTITHEFGHFLSLDHTLVNKTEYLNCAANPRNAACTDTVLANDIPTMVGLFVAGAPLRNLHFDDIATIKRYYSNAAKSNPPTGQNCTIQGFVYDSQSTVNQQDHEWRCEEVVARKDTLTTNAAAFVSGAEVPRLPPSRSDAVLQTECDKSATHCGAFEIRGLPPGTYTMGVHDFTGGDLGGFNIEPCHPPLGNSPNVSVGHTDNDPAIVPADFISPPVVVNCTAGAVVPNVKLFTK